MKTLIIAEKPSVAADLARVLGKVKKQGDYYENDELVISSAVGHLVELFMPEDIDPKLKRWTLASLPIIPEKFSLKPSERTQKKFQELKKLMNRKDVIQVINACDAGREGELIFTYLYEQANCKKPVKRLWMMSMTPEGIREAYAHLRDGKELLSLQEAARSRSEADWLIGINGTRALTSRMYGSRIGQVATVGRVQTPTLTLIVDREREIRAFIPKPYWRIEGTFEIAQGTYTGMLQKPHWKKGADEDDRADRFWEEDQAQALLLALQSCPKATVTEEKKRSRQIAPRLYDLTTLQREANSRFGLPAGKTLQIAQGLYEKHKLITYPRTDSRALPEDYLQTCQDTLQSLGHPWRPHADKVIAERWVRLDKRIFNNKEVSDHFAIIPTKEAVGSLNHDEAKVYDMITKRFIAIFYPPAEYDITTRISHVDDHAFKTEGKVLAEPGWLAVYGKEEAHEASLPALSAADGTPPMAQVIGTEIEAENTKPPARFTEATLLAAMESAGKFVADEEHAEAMQERGLGTPATRAAIIDHLIREKYIERVERHLVPAIKAESLIDFLRAVNVDALTSPAMTGEWEFKLKLIQHGQLSRKEFMEGIANMTRHIVDQTKAFSEEKTETTTLSDILSPTDQLPMLETLRTYRSQDGTITIYKTIGNRKLEHTELKELLEKRRIGPLDNFRSKAGRPFSAMLELGEENKVKFVFDNSGSGAEGEGGEPLDLTQFPAVGPCPLAALGKCKSPDSVVKEAPSAYLCEHFGPKDKGGCTFRLSRTLLGKSLSREIVSQLLHSKKTDLIEGFRSNRTKRLFSAHLIIKDDGGIGFEFAPRAPKVPGAAKGKGKAKKSIAAAEPAAE